jgi:hypothetical protein
MSGGAGSPRRSRLHQPKHTPHCVDAATNANDPRHLCDRSRPGRQRLRREPGGKVTRDHSDVETPQDRLLGLAIKQEFECPPRCNAPACACLPSVARKCLSPSSHDGESRRLPHTDDDREFEWITFAGSLDLDHSYLHRNWCSRSAFSVPKRAAADGPISPVLRTP